MGGGTPKTLLDLGDRGPLLRYILKGLKLAGVEDVLVVTGHRAEDVQDFVTQEWDGEGVSFLRNTRFASWGNFHSVRIAIDRSPGHDLLVVNSDIVIHPDVYTRVVETEGDLVLAVQRRQRLDQEDMRVELKGGRIAAIGKSLSTGRSHGEYAGVSLIRSLGQRAYGDEANRWQWKATTSGYYEDVYAEILPNLEVRAAEVAAGEYAEVDTPQDAHAATEVIDRHFGASTG
jgi:choline kinase